MNELPKTCVHCGDNLSQERLEGLRVLEASPDNYFCFSCATKNIRPVKGLYSGYSGISPLILAKDVGNTNGLVKNESINVDNDEDKPDDELSEFAIIDTNE